MKEDNYSDDLEYEDEGPTIDVMAYVKRLWNKRKYIILFTACFIALGLIKALSSRPVYTSSCTFVPQMGSKKSSSLSSLAALAGMSTLDLDAGATLSPLIYPQLMENADLQRELLYTKLHFEDYDEPISLFDYYMNPEYQKPSIGDYIMAYTYGWPLMILGQVLSSHKEDEQGGVQEVVLPAEQQSSRINRFTKDEYECLKILYKQIAIDVDKKEGYLTLACQMEEKEAAAELCEAVFNLLEKYITSFKIEKAQQNLEYMKSRYEEVRNDYEAKQMALAEFTDANRGTLTAMAQTRREQLTADYNLSYALFTEMSKQYMQAELQVKEDQPVLSVVKSIVVANKRSNSRMKTLFLITLFGGFLSVCSVLVFDFLKKKGSKWPEWWKVDEEAMAASD